MNILMTQVNYVGDMMSFLPAIRGIAQHFPDANISLLCSPVGRDIASRSFPNMKFITVDYHSTRNWRTMPALLLKAWRICMPFNIDVALHSYNDPSFSYILSATLGVPRRVGFDSRIAKFDFLLTEQTIFDKAKNVIDINFELVRRLTGKRELEPERVPMRWQPFEAESVIRRLADIGIHANTNFLAIHAGAKLPYKEWGIPNYQRLAERLEARLKMPVVFIEDGTHRLNGRMIETSTLGELAFLLDRAIIFIGNNSGPMNIAAAAGTPCIVIQGPSPKNWEIFWDDIPHRVIQADHLTCVPCEQLGRVPGKCKNHDYPDGCMKEITIQMVEHSTLQLFQEAEYYHKRPRQSL